MQAEVFDGRTDAEFDEVIAGLLREGRAAEAEQVAFLVACWRASEGRLTATPPATGQGSGTPGPSDGPESAA